MEIAVVCRRGATEKNKTFARALFQGCNPACTFEMSPMGSLKIARRRGADGEQGTAGVFMELAEHVRTLFTHGSPRGRQNWKPDAVIVLWDTDCHPSPQQLKDLICSKIPVEFRKKVHVYFAHPEPEIWLLADFDNAFGKEYDARNVAAIKKGLAKRGIRFGNLEGGLAFDPQRKTCMKKISSLIKNAVEEATGGSFRKPEKTPLLMARLDWQAVARALPTFRPLYDEWLSGKSPSPKLGACA